MHILEVMKDSNGNIHIAYIDATAFNLLQYIIDLRSLEWDATSSLVRKGNSRNYSVEFVQNVILESFYYLK